ncbi:MAG: hypothetical protein ACOYJS_07765, partial [Acutalibacteraceae bacterium]
YLLSALRESARHFYCFVEMNIKFQALYRNLIGAGLYDIISGAAVFGIIQNLIISTGEKQLNRKSRRN